MKNVFTRGIVTFLALLPAVAFAQGIVRFPSDKAANVNPDTHLVLAFPSAPTLGNSGQIRIYDAANNKLVDTLDLSIPPGPSGGARGGQARGAPTTGPATAPARRGGGASYTPVPYEYVPGKRLTNANTVPGTPSGVAVPTPRDYQLTIIGGFTDGFHVYPIIIHDNTATIYPHNNLLEYGQAYYVQVDPGVLSVADGSFKGISGNSGWTFSTKKSAPPADAARLVVAADGTGDFNTVQGAIDSIPDMNPKRVTLYIKNGNYEEIVYFRNKTNITILGEDREKVQVFYNNSEVFNPHPANVLTNEWPGTFPSRRAAFMADHCSGINLVNFSVKTTAYGQAEGLLVVGGQNIFSNLNITGSGDALQINDSVYLVDCHIIGAGDSILGRGPSFFENCELESRGVYMWIRNTAANHGNIFLNCKFQTLNNGSTEFARAPTNGGRGYANAEVVLINCALAGISPAGWGNVGGDTSNVHFWEYNSVNLSDGKPVDVSKRAAWSKQLDKEKDAETIKNYSDPAYVLGWKPAMAPVFVDPPTVLSRSDDGASVTVQAFAVPMPTYQWYKDGQPIEGATSPTLKFGQMNLANWTGSYSVKASNEVGSATCKISKLYSP